MILCGICGVYEFDANSIDPRVLVEMRDTLVHRGPDDAGLYLSPCGKVGLGHRRLSIIDLSARGRQPMSDPSGDLWIVFNGEIYNHVALKADLVRRGYRYRSGTDTETLLYLYKEYGAACLDMLEGMFAFAIWDTRQRTIFLARDRLGVKPLYYSLQGGRFLFGSEPKALLAHPGVRPEVNEAALHHFVSFICVPAPMTLFRGIEKLEPATCMQVGPSGLEFKRRYWTPYDTAGDVPDNEDDWVDAVRGHLREATEKRMMSDVPFGAFLSGGIDSSLNVAYMTELLDRPVDTFTVGFSTEGTEAFNEFAPARVVADRFSTHHREVTVDTAAVLEELSQFIEHQDDPVAHPVCIPFYMMAKAAKRDGVTVVQVGEGSDEIFLGYDRFWEELRTADGWKWSAYHRLPTPLRRAAYEGERAYYGARHPGREIYFRPRQEYLRRAGFGEEIFWGGLLCFPEDRKKDLFSKEFRRRNRGVNTFRDVLAPMYSTLTEDLPRRDQAQYMSFVEMQLRLPEHLLMRVDKMAMASSVEARVPFLDHRLVELAFQMPRSVKLSAGPKSVLKRAARGKIPDQIIDRRKQGFAAPATAWFREIPEEFERALLRSPLSEAGIFEHSFLENLVEIVRRTGKWELQAWSMYILARWYERWIAGADSNGASAVSGGGYGVADIAGARAAPGSYGPVGRP